MVVQMIRCQNQCKRRASIILLKTNQKWLVCAECYINLKGLRGDYEHWKKEKRSEKLHGGKHDK